MTQAAIKPMADRLTFNELVARAGTWDQELCEMPSMPAADVDVKGEHLTFGNISIPMSQESRSRLFGTVKAPWSYLAERSIDTQIVALLEHIRQGDYGTILTPVTRNGELFTFSTGKLVEATHAEVLRAVLESLGPDADTLRLSKVDRSESGFELDLVCPGKSLEVQRGDIVEAGIHIAHSRYSGEATQVHAYVYRLVCENGMIRRECVSAEGIVRTRKLPTEHPRAKELLLDQIRRLTAQTWAKLGLQLTQLRATSERQADVQQLLRQWLQRARISIKTTEGREGKAKRTVLDRLLDAWRMEGADDTY